MVDGRLRAVHPPIFMGNTPVSQQATPPIRVKVRAAVVSRDQVLLVEYGDGREPHYNLPGGRVEPNESLIDALMPEVREETCAAINMAHLVLVCEFNARHATYEPGMTPAWS